MAKKQKCFSSMLYKNSQSDDTPLIQTSSSSKGVTSHAGLTSQEIVVSQWKDAWHKKIDWIEFDTLTGKFL